MQRKNIFLLGVLVVVAGAVAFYFLFGQSWLNNRTVSLTVPMTIENPIYGLAFSYPSGEDGYALIEPPMASSSELKQAYILIDNSAYIDFQSKAETTEAPPTISIFIFDAPEQSDEQVDAGRVTRLQNWVVGNPQYSSFSLVTDEPEILKLDGATALRYHTEGLYQQEVYVVSYLKHIYVLVGQYETEDDPSRVVFADIVRSVALD